VGVSIILYYWHIGLASSHSTVPKETAKPPSKLANEFMEQYN
jgi:hypothetical protein